MMTILASRERFCLHPDIAVAPNKTEACEQGESFLLGSRLNHEQGHAMTLVG